jgi:hypothetical protein
MVVIATADPDMALRLGRLIDERKSYVLGPPGSLVVTLKTAEEEARRFRHAIHSAQPGVLVLDVRVGKNVFEAFGQVPRLLEVESGPAVIILLPVESSTVRDAAAALGCYDVIVIDRRRAFEKKVALAVTEASAARAAGALERRRPGGLH